MRSSSRGMPTDFHIDELWARTWAREQRNVLMTEISSVHLRSNTRHCPPVGPCLSPSCYSSFYVQVYYSITQRVCLVSQFSTLVALLPLSWCVSFHCQNYLAYTYTYTDTLWMIALWDELLSFTQASICSFWRVISFTDSSAPPALKCYPKKVNKRWSVIPVAHIKYHL